MKKIIALFAIASIIVSCSNSKPVSPKVKHHIDTAKVQVVYKLQNWRIDSAVRIIKDTFRLEKIVDSARGQAKMEWRRDTLYYIPIVTDTLKKEVKWFGVPPYAAQEVTVRPLTNKY